MLKKIILTIALLNMFVSPILAQVEWVETCSIVIHYNATYQCGEYSLTEIQFTKSAEGYTYPNKTVVPEYTILPQVMLSIYKNNEFDTFIFLEPENNEYMDSFRRFKIISSAFSPGNSIVWVNGSYDPVATLKFYLRKVPNPQEVKISVDKLKYNVTTDSVIYANISIKNLGTTNVNDIGVSINSTLETSDSIAFNIEQLNVSAEYSKRIRYTVPSNISNTTIKLSVKIKDPLNYVDYFYYNATVNVSFIQPTPSPTPNVTIQVQPTVTQQMTQSPAIPTQNPIFQTTPNPTPTPTPTTKGLFGLPGFEGAFTLTILVMLSLFFRRKKK